MKKVTLLFIALIGISVLAFSQDKYTMFKTIYLKPDYSNLKKLGKAMADHNKKYHNEGPNTAGVFVVNSGPHTGEWLYVVGPTTYSEMDDVHLGDDHKEHWLFEVMPYIKQMSDGNFWRQDDKYTYFHEGEYTGKEVLTYFDIKDWEGYRFNEILAKVKAVYDAKKYGHSFQVLRPEFDILDGPDVMIASDFPNWAYFDRDRTFKKDFEEVHGENSWWKFMEEFKAVVEGTYDEVIIYVPELSGGADE